LTSSLARAAKCYWNFRMGKGNFHQKEEKMTAPSSRNKPVMIEVTWEILEGTTNFMC